MNMFKPNVFRICVKLAMSYYIFIQLTGYMYNNSSPASHSV